MKHGQDFTGVSVVFFCHDGQGKFVFGKRGSSSRDEIGVWDCGGGRLEFGDQVIDRLKAEIKEEYCAEVLAHEFLGYRDVHRIYDGKPTHWVALDFKVLVDPVQVKNGEPHKIDAIEWFTKDNIPSPVHSEIPRFLEMYKDKLFS